MKRVIVNADDFGLTQGVNEGIVLAHKKGILTSATLMANMPGFGHALELAGENETLGIGAHLNIVRGRPIENVGRVKSLVDGEGYFLRNIPLILGRLMTRRIRAEEVERELRAQVEKILKHNLLLTHFDTEKHIHAFPPLFRMLIRLAKEYEVRKIRYLNETCLTWPVSQSLKSLWLAVSSSMVRRSLEQNGIKTTDRFYGVCRSGRMTATEIKRILTNLEEGTCEIMVHPGYLTPELKELEKKSGSYYINKYREDELQALLDPDLRDVVAREGIRLINFKGL